MKILVITRSKSDLTNTIKNICSCDILAPNQAENTDLSLYSAIAVLGGSEEAPLMLAPFLREALEAFADSGKPIFLEFVPSFRCVYSAQPERISCDRLVVAKSISDDLGQYDLLDSHYNLYLRPHFLMPDTEILLYYQKYTPAHDRLDSLSDTNNPAMFRYDNILHCAFILSNWRKAEFAPKSRWNELFGYIFEFLGITQSKLSEDESDNFAEDDNDFNKRLDNAIDNSLKLLTNYLVTPDGRLGIHEGLSHNIRPDGSRIFANVVRADCTGEAAGVFLFSQDEHLMSIADNMLALCYGPLTIHENEFDGMMRWSEEAWNVCYQDDVARAIIPSLLCAYLGLTDKYASSACNALDFLCRTTAKDGLRPMRTDILEFLKDKKSLSTLADLEQGYASAHYNAYYSAALLLGYLVSGNESFKKTGIKGLETLMSLYPETVREHSETSELCRLIFPLSLLYCVTDDPKHKAMLFNVFSDLQKFKHPSGGYAEWDNGYKAVCFNNSGGECSLLSKNGDPVADLLYSLNWLPLGFAFAYHATSNSVFYNAWRDICSFFIKIQIKSDNPFTNGAWCRGIDLNRLEYYGIPHDVGWGPCCIETGWTLGEITLGMLVGRRIFNKQINP